MPDSENPLTVQEYGYIIDPASLTRFLKIMLWIFLGVCLLSLQSDFMQMNLLGGGSFSQAKAESNDARQRIIGLVFLAAFIVTGIAFLKWIYRANSNCRGFGAQDMEFSPGWSIGYYFIPIMNLYRPFAAMKEIWKVSGNPANWRSATGSPLLGWWWALWLISGILGQVSFRMSLNTDTISSLQVATIASIISAVVDIPLCLVSVKLVSAVFAKQESLVKKDHLI